MRLSLRLPPSPGSTWAGPPWEGRLGFPPCGAPHRHAQGRLGEGLLSLVEPSLNPITPHLSACVMAPGIYLLVYFIL